MIELSLSISHAPILFASILPAFLERLLSTILIAGIISVLVEIWFMKLFNWGSWKLCVADTLLLNVIASLSLLLVYTVTRNILPVLLTSNPIPAILIATSVKCLVAHKLSDRPWFISLVSNIASYISFVVVLRCLFWIFYGFR